MAEEHTRFRARTIRAATLEVLTRAVHGDPPSGHEVEWAELVDARIASAPGALRPRWREVLTEAASAPIAYEISGRMGRAGMHSTITLTPRFGLSLTERRKLTVTDSHVAVEAVEDAVEIALFEPRIIWPAVQRLLPPSPVLRAEDGPSPREERTVGVITDVPERSALPQEVLQQLAAADVEVNLALQVANGTETPFVTSRHWLEAPGGQLHEVRLLEGAVEVVQVPQGTVAGEIAWLTVGAFDLRARARREAS